MGSVAAHFFEYRYIYENITVDEGQTLMRRISISGLLLIAILFSCHRKSNEKLRIAAASNMQFSIEVLVQELLNQTGIECEIIVSSSGKLATQIMRGAPYDVFLSADMKYLQELENLGLTVTKPKVYAYGKLVVWGREGSLKLDYLLKEDVKKIAIANPKTAPYGCAAVEALRSLGIYEKVNNKLVYGESISQVNQFIKSGVVDVAFTSKSMVLSQDWKNSCWEEVDNSLYSPIVQGTVMIKGVMDKSEKAKSFLNFLSSNSAKKILEQFGYQIPQKHSIAENK